jgi:hypothetical protein
LSGADAGKLVGVDMVLYRTSQQMNTHVQYTGQARPVKPAVVLRSDSPLPQHEEPVLGEHRQDGGECVVGQSAPARKPTGSEPRGTRFGPDAGVVDGFAMPAHVRGIEVFPGGEARGDKLRP